MGMLGAELGQMRQLSAQMNRTTNRIATAQTSTNKTTNQVVTGVQNDAQTAMSRIDSALADLTSSVSEAVSTAQGTSWVGANNQRFMSAANDFQQHMNNADQATRDAFQKFQKSINQMAQAIEEYQASFSTALTNAQTSTESMRQAVDSQTNELDRVMNTGLTAG